MPSLAGKAASPKGYQPHETAVVRDLGEKYTRDTDLPAAVAVAPLSCREIFVRTKPSGLHPARYALHSKPFCHALSPPLYTLRPTPYTLNPSVMPSNLRQN
jgi:hypothetical protein